jgi:hypothetical protein
MGGDLLNPVESAAGCRDVSLDFDATGHLLSHLLPARFAPAICAV